jgi:hypothetical protein
MMPKPDTQAVLDGLKPFQRDTVEYVFDRLYMNPGSRRFLIADEVGLGKTLVARGVIAKAIEHLWDQVERIDVIYICSNADIARQNINRLNITGRQDFTHARRITLLPKFLHSLDSKLNFVSFTPGTSFQLKSSLGIWEERVLIYWMLRWSWDLNELGLARLMQGGVEDHDSWIKRLEGFRSEYSFDQTLTQNFCRALNSCPSDSGQPIPSIKCRFEQICAEYRRCQDPKMVPAEIARERNRLVGEVRAILARTCISALEPDVVILDEFQRFKDLLDGESDASRLARELLEYEDDTTRVRTMLLSATPYKMYTLYQEEEDHHQDFLRTLEFLENDLERSRELRRLLKEYRRCMYHHVQDDPRGLFRLKEDIEKRLRQVMVRTERLAGQGCHDSMLRECCLEVVPQSDEIMDYLAGQKLSDLLGAGDYLEYWKAAPYLLCFMDGYKLKEQLKAAGDNGLSGQVAELFRISPRLSLPWEDIKDFRHLDPRNAKMRQLWDETLGKGLWKLLWMPPTLPYYRPEGLFAQHQGQSPTKRMIFSTWTVVPKTISAVLSYEADRLAFSSFEDHPQNTPEARSEYRRLLDFRRQEGKPAGMPVLAMLYPSPTLAREGDPLPFIQKAAAEESQPPSLSEVISRLAARFERLIQDLDLPYEDSGQPDNAWYWVVPLVLDLQEGGPGHRAWFGQKNLDRLWMGEDEGEELGEQASGWKEHVRLARDLVFEGFDDLGRPPRDLARILAQLALAGPGVCSLRAFGRIAPTNEETLSLEACNQAARTAWAFRRLFNQTKNQALLRGMDDSRPYWKNVLEYCAEGGLQSVLDEYVHILNEYLGVAGHAYSQKVSEIGQAIRRALSLKTARVEVDDVQAAGNGDISINRRNMRSHFALRFGQQTSEDGTSGARENQVREAFNSPFWPFVLATTSVGQEGLDFHPYCHAITHWNLPSNPVDLEQREGRIHRYKGHAVRKNVAAAYITSLTNGSGRDPWQTLFEAGDQEHRAASRGLVPFWIFSRENGAAIQRCLASLPLSREQHSYQALKQSLAVYRMVFGQARQEDLIEYLLQHLPEDRVDALARQLQMDLAPPRYRQERILTFGRI